MRPYRQYTPDQAFLVPPALADMIPSGDPVFFLREVLQRLDLDAFTASTAANVDSRPITPS